MKLLRRTKKATNQPLMFSPVFCEELLGAMYQKGEFLPHARYKALFKRPSILCGTILRGDEPLYFVASNLIVIEHIEKQGLVPLSETEHLHFFKDKKRMNAFLSTVA